MNNYKDISELDAAIKHAQEVADECFIENEKCSNDHKQLAEWLKELKMFRLLNKSFKLK